MRRDCSKQSSPLTWSPCITFTVPGPPHAKKRPRFARLKTGAVRTYTDRESASYERTVAILCRSKTRGQKLAPAGTPVRVDILAVYPRPKRLNRASDPVGPIQKCNRAGGDLDNHIKAILDGLNGSGIWEDDGQVSVIRAEAVIAGKSERAGSLVSIFLPDGAS